jgi:hypothetical protein
MLHTFEADMEPNGLLHFSGFDQPKYDEIQKVLVTVMADAKRTKTPATRAPAKPNAGWGDLLGSLKGSPNFGGDPIAIQQRMRNEWD